MDPSHFDLVPNRIFVGGLPLTANETELKEYFNQFPNCVVSEAKIIIDPRTNISKGYGFVTFEDEREVVKLISEKSGSLSFQNQALKISQAYKRKYTNNMYKNHNNYSYSNKNKPSNQQMTVQIEDFNKFEDYLISPNSRKFLNLTTPASECQSVTKQLSSTASEKSTNSTIDKVSETGVVDANVIIEITGQKKEDSNNNLIDTKLMENIDVTKRNLPLDDFRKTNNQSVYTNYKSKNYEGYQRNSTTSNRAQNSNHINNRYQANSISGNKIQHNQNTSNNPISTANKQYSYNHSTKTYNQHALNQQRQSQMQFCYAMAMNMHMNMNSQMTHQQPNVLYSSPKSQQALFKSRQNRDFFKSSNDYAGSIMNTNQSNPSQNLHATKPSVVHSNQQAINNNHDMQKKNILSPQYGYQGQSKKIHQSSTSNSQVPSIISNYSSSSSSSSACSTTPRNQLNSIKIQSAQEATRAANAEHTLASNTAVSYVNHSAAINSAAAVTLPPLNINSRLIPVNSNPASYEQYQNGDPQVYTEHQYGMYPNVSYYQTNINSDQSNTPPNDISSNTNTSSTVSSITPGPLTPKSQYSTVQPHTTYYPPNYVPTSAPTFYQQPLQTPTEIQPSELIGYSKMQAANNSTITNAFETATNSESHIDLGQSTSAEPLDEIFSKQLSLNTDCSEQQQQMMYAYYTPQHTSYQPNPSFSNVGMGGPVAPQYLYYYAPVLDMPPNTPQTTFDHTQLQAKSTFHPVSISNSYLPPPPLSNVFHPNSVSNPIHVNTMITNAQPTFQPNSAPVGLPVESYYAPLTYPEHQQHGYQHIPALISPQVPTNNTNMPLLQMPPMSYPYMPPVHNSNIIQSQNLQLQALAAGSPAHRIVNHTEGSTTYLHQQSIPQYYQNPIQNLQSSAYNSNSSYKNSGGSNKPEIKVHSRQTYIQENGQNYCSQGSYLNKLNKYYNNNQKNGLQKSNNDYNSNHRSTYNSESKSADIKEKDLAVKQI